MSRLIVLANEATAAQRRVYFHLVDATDGMTPETGEAGGQPQVSSDGAAWTNTGIGTLSAIGNGRYYADLTQTLVQTAGTLIETRYKSANTAECPGDSVQVVAYDPNSATNLGLSYLSGDAFDRLGAPAGASVSADVAAVKVDTAAILVDTGTTLDGKIDAIDDLIDTEVAAIKSDTAAILLDTGTDGVVVATATQQAIADVLLGRNVSGGSSTGRTVKQALATLRNKVSISAGTLTVYDTDDTTVLFTAAITTAAGNPITVIDPA